MSATQQSLDQTRPSQDGRVPSKATNQNKVNNAELQVQVGLFSLFPSRKSRVNSPVEGYCRSKSKLIYLAYKGAICPDERDPLQMSLIYYGKSVQCILQLGSGIL